MLVSTPVPSLPPMLGVTRGVLVSTPVPSLPPVLESGFESPFGFEFLGFSMWYFLSSSSGVFLRVLRFLPLLHRLMVQPIT